MTEQNPQMEAISAMASENFWREVNLRAQLIATNRALEAAQKISNVTPLHAVPDEAVPAAE